MIYDDKGRHSQPLHQSEEKTLLCFLHPLEYFAAVSAGQLAFHWERSSQHLHMGVDNAEDMWRDELTCCEQHVGVGTALAHPGYHPRGGEGCAQ